MWNEFGVYKYHYNHVFNVQAALASTEAGIVNVLSASSCFFTLLLGAAFPSTDADKATITKVSQGYIFCKILW